MEKTNQELLINIKGLTHCFGEGKLANTVLNNIDLVIPKGRVVILTGPSGSGKTTLLTLIGSLRRPQKGSVNVLGQELVSATYQEELVLRKEIGFIFQSHNLIPSLTASQNVAMTLELNLDLTDDQRAQQSNKMLQLIGMGERVDYYPDNLSGGQCQRVAIARALVGEPKLILADEPTASLDSKSGQDVMTFIKNLCREKNCSALVVTHDARVSQFADHIINLEDGHITSGNIKVD